MSDLPAFAELAGAPDAGLDVLALALAAEFREVDAPEAMATLDVLGEELSRELASVTEAAEQQALACGRLLGVEHGFAGDREDYDNPDNSMLDLVLTTRRGLPIVLSVVYVEVARRAGIPLAGVGLPGHFVVGHFGAHPPVLIDPFAGGAALTANVPEGQVQPWGPHETAMRMLNNLVLAYQRRGDIGAAIHAASMRLVLPADESHRVILEAELRAMRARLN
ncbi:MAG TPA: transglutaminase-like domain-containing protein [Solirubrobacteraceae bacterium]|jgi:regulator of sirC expression with transglutaminase-like and TPR domain|nr:transglutaminase-like domain-containing protein [Solirubrobacteraceae bacterium]